MATIINKFFRSTFRHIVKINITCKRNLTLSVKLNKMISATSFKFTDYDCIGFDLDNTICKYKLGPMIKMEYEALSKYLVEEKKYCGKYLLKPIEENIDFLMKGLILDFHKGNILKINLNGTIIKASHGTKQLSEKEIQTYYGIQKHWEVTDAFTKDLLSTWNGPLSEKMRSLLDYFDMPTALAFARIVDTIDENESNVQMYNIWPDLLAGLNYMFEFKQFELDQGGYFPNMKQDPEKYIQKCSPDLIQWLKDLKNRNKILFLMTGSYVDFANLTSSTCLGADWYKLFDIIIFFAKKPGFFTENRPFLCAKSKNIIASNDLQKNQWYIQGNMKDLHKFLAKISNKSHPKIAYIGDNLIQDVYTPSVHSNCDAVAICEEIEAEGIFGFEDNHYHKDFLSSEQWGSYFHNENNEDSMWLDIIKKHAKICAPNMEYFAKKPVDFLYKM